MSMATTYDILLSLEEMFGCKGRLARQSSLKVVMDTKMLKWTFIKYHMISMIRLFN